MTSRYTETFKLPSIVFGKASAVAVRKTGMLQKQTFAGPSAIGTEAHFSAGNFGLSFNFRRNAIFRKCTASK